MKEGNPTFDVRFRYLKGQSWGSERQLSMNFFINLTVVANIGHILCMPCSDDSEECYYIDLYTNTKYLKFAPKMILKFRIQKEGTNFSSLGWGKKRGGTKIFLKP